MASNRSSCRRLAVIVAVVACAAPQVASAETVPLPPGALTGSTQDNAIYDTSCPDAGACTSVGFYEDAAGNGQALIETENSYAWSAQDVSLASLPGGVYSNPDAELDAVSCKSVGNCVAAGDYIDAGDNVQGLIDTETKGAWTVSRLPLSGLPNTATDPEISFTSVSCPAATVCVAVGSYNDSAGHQQALIAMDYGGTWGAQKADLSSFSTYSNPYGALTQISCASIGTCVAVGSFRDAADNDEGLIETETGGLWSSSRPDLTHLANAASAPEDGLESVSCPSAGDCTAVGFYLDDSTGGSEQGMLLSQANGSWAPAAEAQLPGNANTTAGAQSADLWAVSCVTAGDCSAVGSYRTTTASDVKGYAVTETGGSWSTGTQLNLPQDAAAKPDADPSSISCSAPSSCVAAGSYTDSSGQYDALLAQQSAGSWTTAGIAQPTSTGVFPVSYASVACAPGGYCAAGGATLSWSGSNNEVAFLFDAPAAVSSSSTSVVLSPAVSTVSVRVNWTPPADTGGLPVSGYTVTANDVGNPNHYPLSVDTGSTATFSSLTSGHTYTFTITPLSLLGNGQPVTTAALTLPFSTQKLRISLAGLMAPQGIASRRRRLARSHLYTFAYKPLEPGKVSVLWYETTGRGKHRHRHLFASGSAVATSTAAVKIPVRLTGFGRRAVKAGHRLSLKTVVTFVSGSTKATRTGSFTLH